MYSESEGEDFDEQQPNTPAGKSDMGYHEESSSDEGVLDPEPIRKKKALSTNDLAEGDLLAGFEVVSAMTAEQMNHLIETLDSMCAPTDTLSVYVRTKRIKWDKVAFDDFSANDCRVAWLYIKHQARKFRIMHEVVQEIKLAASEDIERYRCRLIETSPGYPKKPPPSAATLFVREMWKANPENHKINFLVFQKECMEEFQKLTSRTQLSWQKKLDDANAEYEIKVREFYAKYPNYDYDAGKKPPSRRALAASKASKAKGEKPGREKARTRITTTSQQSELFPDAPRLPSNPQVEFVQSKIDKLDPVPTGTLLTELKQKYKGKWEKLSDRKKSKWVLHVLERLHSYCEELQEYQQEHPDYTPRPMKVRNHLTKADIDLWAYMNGQPEKPANNIFDFYWRSRRSEPEHAELEDLDSRRLAEEEYKTLDAYDKELWKINYRKNVLEYKKNIERFFEWTPDMLKPHILYRIPKKYQSVIMTHVEKLPANFVLEAEEKAELMLQQQHEEDDQDQDADADKDPLAESGSKKKRKKSNVGFEETADVVPKDEPLTPKKKRKHDTAPEPEEPKHKKKKKHSEEQEDDDDIVVYVDQDKILNGKVTKDKGHKVKNKKEQVKVRYPVHKKPEPNDFREGLSPTTNDIDDVIRGIFDGRPHIGRNFSVFYYYARYVAPHSAWVKLIKKDGLLKSAQMIFNTFLGLTHHKKNLFIHQSWEWHESTKSTIPHKQRIGDDMLMPGEPVPPVPTALTLYQREKKVADRLKKPLPTWSSLGEEGQLVYTKKLYRDTRKYLGDYEEYLMKLSPEEFTSYVLVQAKKWERRTLMSNPLRAAWRGYIFPLPTDKAGRWDDCGGPDESDTEVLEPDVFRVRADKRRIHSNLPSVLDNDDFIKEVTSTVGPEERTLEELWADADESTTDEDDEGQLTVTEDGTSILPH